MIIISIHIFVETDTFYLSGFFDEYKVQKNRVIFCDIINVFTVTFDQFNASLSSLIFFFILTACLNCVFKVIKFNAF